MTAAAARKPTTAKLRADRDFQAPPASPEPDQSVSAECSDSAAPPMDSEPTGINPPKPTNPPLSGTLAATVITSHRPAILTKTFALSDCGELVKSSIANLTAGKTRTIAVPGLTAFAAMLDDLTPNQALVYGIADGHQTADLIAEKDAKKFPQAITRTRRFFGFPRAPGIWMLDHDAKAGHLIEPADLIATLKAVAPCLADAPMLWRASASSCITAPDGRALTGITGQRVYIPVTDAGLIPKAGKAIVDLLWASGYGWIEIGKAGQALERTMVDASVWQPERLDFAAPPKLGPGLTRNPPPATIDGDPAGQFDLRALLDLADGTVQARASAARKAARAAAKPELHTARETWIEDNAPGIAAAHGLEVEAVKDSLRRAAGRLELTGDFILRCSDGTTPRVGDLLDNPAKWHGKRFSDPLEPDYSTDARIAWANLRSGGRPYLFSHAHGGRRFYLIRPSARIELKKGDRARVVDQTLDLLRARGELYDFGTGSALARVTEDARVLPVGRDWLTDHLDRVAEFYVLVAPKDPDDPPKEESTDAPTWGASRIIAKDGERRLSCLDAVVTAPTLRMDGSILSDPGYDAASRLLLVTDSPDLPHIPERPTPDQARAALETLWHPFRLFPLVDEVDRGVILSGLLTACVRASLPTAPGIALDAPTAGTGKTLLGQAIAALSIGYAPPALPPAGNQDDETRKRLFAALRDGHRVLLWDNVREPLGNAALDAFMTAPTFTDRILGVSQTATLPNRALFICTGNNIRLLGDTCRRILPARLDARLEKPYVREFAFCPLETVLSRRFELVTAALTLIRAWIADGRLRHGKGRTASFEAWDDLVRQSVCWIATWDSRFSDPLTATERAFDMDPETAKLAALLSAWDSQVSTRPTTTARLLEVANMDASAPDPAPSLFDAITEIAGERGTINRRILGRWIERHVERRHNGIRVERGKLLRGSPTWILVRDQTADAHIEVSI